MNIRKIYGSISATLLAATAIAFATTNPVSAATPHSEASVNRCLHRWTFQSMGLNDDAPAGYLNVDGAGGSGTVVITWYSSPNASNEWWCMEPANEGGWYFHPSYDLSLCLDTVNGVYYEGAVLEVYHCDGTKAQRFTFGSGDTLIRSEVNLNLGLMDSGYGGAVSMQKAPNRTFWR